MFDPSQLHHDLAAWTPIIRPMRVEDVPKVVALEGECFPTIPAEKYWKPEMLQAHIDRFPDGQWVADVQGNVVASCTNLRVPLERALAPHTWREITGNGMLGTHDPDGDAMYGTELMVHPLWRRNGLARSMYQRRKKHIRKTKLRAFVSGGRIPGYRAQSARMTPEQYVEAVARQELRDPVLTPQLKSGLRVGGILPRYITDPDSLDHATLLVWSPRAE